MPTTSLSVTLNGTPLHPEPGGYDPLSWPRRYSAFRSIGGSVTVQDFGVRPEDAVVRLRGRLDVPGISAVQQLGGQRGAPCQLKDWLGNDFMVSIRSFSVSGTGAYSMELQIKTVNTVLGSPWRGR